METEEEIQDHLITESQATTLGEETEPTSSYEIVYPEVPETELESKPEYSNNEELHDMELYVATIEAANPVIRLITLISKDAGVVFPIIEGKRQLYLHRFENMLERIRALLWDYRQVNMDWDAYAYVADRLPIGSKFNPRGGYTTLDGVAISRQIRE